MIFKDTDSHGEMARTEKTENMDRFETGDADIPRMPPGTEIMAKPMSEQTEDSSHRRAGVISDSGEVNYAEATDSPMNRDYSEYLSKADDGSYTDKETGKKYDSTGAWLKAQDALEKRYENVGDYYSKKFEREKIRFSSLEQNTLPNREKRVCYLKMQEYYNKAKENYHEAGKIREKLEKTTNMDDELCEKLGQTADTGNQLLGKLEQTADTTDQERIQNVTRELTDEEKQYYKDKLGWSDEKLKKCTIDQDGVIQYKTDRCDLEGKTSENGVPYVRRTIEINGIKIEGVFPEFDSVFDTKLDPSNYKSRAYAKECNAKLKEAINNDPELRSKFNAEQLADIEAGRTPTGYVWHHNEEPGKMQLVKRKDHDRAIGGAAHTGGNALWGPDSVENSRKGENF